MSEDTKDMPKVSSDMESPKVLNYIEKLVAELCPEGVEYKALGDFSLLIRGQGMPKSDFSDTGIGAIHYGQVYTRYGIWTKDVISYVSSETARNLVHVNHGDLIITNTSENLEDVCKSVAYLGEDYIVTGGHATVISQHGQNAKYLSYYFASLEFQKNKKKYAFGTKVIEVSSKNLAKILIPVPPLEVQNAIVDILDKFTELEAELEAELAARRAQYEYYRKLLLENITNRVSVERVELSEIFDISNGYTPKKSVSSYWDDGNVPWFRMEDIRRNGRVLSESLIKVHESAVKKSGLFPENSIIVATSATIGEHALIKIPFLCNQRFTALILKEKYINKLDRKFLFYYCFVLDEWCRNNTTQSSFASVDMKGFRKFVFPVPSLTEQERIVKILDKFDALVNDISSGLPAEIEARRKQYEYYRDRLLTFPRKFEPTEQAMQR